MKVTLWISLFLIFYTFLGYGILLFILVKLKRLLKGNPQIVPNFNTLPTCTLIVAAYNEEEFIEEKIANTLSLNYPNHLLKFIFITDGSSDQTPNLVNKYPQIKLMHKPDRLGKIVAVHRAMQEVDTEVVVFTDANTFLNKDALINICKHYLDPKTGAVAGEKRVKIEEKDGATAGEGFYWKYESKLKAWDSELYSVVGAAGELFSIKTSLYQPVPKNSVLDDFMISMLIAQRGYKIVYEPEAYATERSSENVSEELKRKIRIAAGGIQSIVWLKNLLNPFKQPVLSFQYISHRVLRWTITPFLMVLTLLLNVLIVSTDGGLLFQLVLICQLGFYLSALLGLILENKKIRVKILFIPYYFCVMNYAVIAGINRYINGAQSVIWEKAKRAS
ncbi:MAG: glycosyltransferase [Sphingobacteriales bacterium]|nr:glycosyltransferase [Sphingobacteriales bacterium]